jgi:hypothetical protein
MPQSAAEPLRRRPLEVLQRVIDVTDIEIGLASDDVVRAAPKRLVGLEPSLLVVGQRVHTSEHP